MQRAIALARSVRGTTSPNPPVGAVIVNNGRVVGEGATRPAGGRHAERVAIAAAGDAARGGTLYVSLEPCAHFGRNPPCVEAIVAAGIAEVRLALIDPNPLVNGKGVAGLEEEGVSVQIGDGASEASEIIGEHLGQFPGKAGQEARAILDSSQDTD